MLTKRTEPAVTMTDLVRDTLRLRPDRIAIGEVRDCSALDLLKAWNTGHPGGLATLHANSAAADLAVVRRSSRCGLKDGSVPFVLRSMTRNRVMSTPDRNARPTRRHGQQGRADQPNSEATWLRTAAGRRGHEPRLSRRSTDQRTLAPACWLTGLSWWARVWLTFALPTHATMRTQQRVVAPRLIDPLMSYAGFEAPVSGRCTVLRKNRDRLDDLDLTDRLGAELKRLRGMSLVWSEGTRGVIRVLRMRKGAAGRRYRRGGH